MPFQIKSGVDFHAGQEHSNDTWNALRRLLPRIDALFPLSCRAASA